MPPKVNRKICVMGYRAVVMDPIGSQHSLGKSTITIQFVEGHFVDSYNPTIENTFHKTIKFKGVEYETDIIDTAGQDEYSIFQKHYAIGIHGYILVYAVTSRKSLETIKILNDNILNALGVSKVPRVIVGNKTDLSQERKVTKEEVQKLADEWGCAFIECSGKLNEHVEDIFNTMIGEIEKDSTPPPEPKSECVIL